MEAVGREGGQERVSEPHSSRSSQTRFPHHSQQYLGWWGLDPCMKNHGGKPAQRRGSRARALHPGCTGSEKHGLCPLPTLSSKKQPGALSQSLIYFLEGRASQDGKRKRRHSRVNFFEGEAICTLGTISTVFFYQSPDCQRPRRLGPSTFELLTRPGPAAHLFSSISPGLF